MGRLIAALAAWVRRRLPQTYVRVEDCALQGWFVCDLAEAANIVAEELRRLQADPLHWTWRDDTLLVGELRITFVRMSPRRFEALPEFMGY